MIRRAAPAQATPRQVARYPRAVAVLRCEAAAQALLRGSLALQALAGEAHAHEVGSFLRAMRGLVAETIANAVCAEGEES